MPRRSAAAIIRRMATIAASSDVSVPRLVRRHVQRALPDGGDVPAAVRLSQQGEMWRSPGARSMRFSAVERLAVDRTAFSWQARFPALGPLGIRVTDAYDGEQGTLAVSVLGLPVQRLGGAELSAGEALRYLAELPWVPYAMVCNHGLAWRPVDARRVEVRAASGDPRAVVEFEFDAAGDIVGTLAPARPRQVGERWVPTPWEGSFSAYRTLGGVRIPTSAEVRWLLPEGPFVYWRGEVTGLELEAR